MRITSSIIFNELMSALQKNQEENSVLAQRLGSQKKILAPSDNVIGTARAMDYQVSINDNGQYQTNIDGATNNLNLTSTVLSSLSDMVEQAINILNASSSGTSDAGIEATRALQAGQTRDQIAFLSNTKVGNSYLFSGFKTDQQSYAAGTFAYQGDAGIVNVPIGHGATMAANVPGSTAFSYTPPAAPYQLQISNGMNVHYTAGAGTTVNVEIRDAADTTVLDTFNFSNVMQMTDLLSSAISSNDTSRILALSDPFSKMQDQVGTVQADVGTRLNALKDQSSLLSQNTNTLQNALSSIEDLDTTGTAEVAMQLQQTNNALQALYSTSAKILPPSLFDFLK